MPAPTLSSPKATQVVSSTHAVLTCLCCSWGQHMDLVIPKNNAGSLFLPCCIYVLSYLCCSCSPWGQHMDLVIPQNNAGSPFLPCCVYVLSYLCCSCSPWGQHMDLVLHKMMQLASSTHAAFTCMLAAVLPVLGDRQDQGLNCHCQKGHRCSLCYCPFRQHLDLVHAKKMTQVFSDYCFV